MIIKKVVLSIVVTTLIYSIVVFIISPFLIAFGERTFLNIIIDFLFSFPVNWHDLIVNKSLLFVVLNGLFWSILGHIIFYSTVISFGKNDEK
ncbi:MAG TPA: hypothetical protein VIM88_01590 [Sulfurovum sp.]|uniref:hypothetical protein n=1 Tax=Sulfurovum sp. TaxID=1969726 RepID=UPI002F95D71D